MATLDRVVHKTAVVTLPDGQQEMRTLATDPYLRATGPGGQAIFLQKGRIFNVAEQEMHPDECPIWFKDYMKTVTPLAREQYGWPLREPGEGQAEDPNEGRARAVAPGSAEEVVPPDESSSLLD